MANQRKPKMKGKFEMRPKGFSRLTFVYRFAVPVLVVALLMFAFPGCMGIHEPVPDNALSDGRTQQNESVDMPEQVIGYDANGQISRTIMIYIIGSDLESEHGLATSNMGQILTSGVDLSWNNIIIQTGGAARWECDIPSDKNLILEVVADDLRIAKEKPAQNMAAPQTLTDFLSFCYENYKSDAYSLILWNHGAGPMFGYGYDEIAKDILTLPELSTALGNSPFGSGNKLEFIGFDACLMGSIETAFVLKDSAEYLIASQETMPGWGWDYTCLGDIEPTMSTEEVAGVIIDSYYELCNIVFELRPELEADVTLSCLDLSQISGVEKHLNTLYAKVGESLDATSFPSVARSRSNAKEFGLFSTDMQYDLVDIQHLCSLMSTNFSSDANDLSSALKKLIVYNKSNIPNANGVSMYYPYKNKDLLNMLSAEYETFNFADDYVSYMQKFIKLLQEEPLSDWNLSKAIPIQETASRFSMQLTPEQVQTYDHASYYVFLKREEGNNFDGYYIVFNSTDVSLEMNGVLYANYEGKMQQILEHSTGDTGFCLMRERERSDTYVRYSIPVLLVGLEETGDYFPDIKMIMGELQLQTDKEGENATILSVIPISSEKENPYLAEKQLIDIYDFTEAHFPYFGRTPIYDDIGRLKPFGEWEVTGKAIETLLNWDEDAEDVFSFVQKDIDNNEKFFLVFNIWDVQGNIASSNLIPIEFK